MIDLQDNNRWIELGESKAWNWQQGCMLQWIPGSESKVLWNDRQGARFVSHILDVKTEQRRTVPHAIYTLSPDGKSAVTADFRRIGDVRPGYGYAGLNDPHAHDMAPEDSGVFHIDLETSDANLILSLAEISKLGEIPTNNPASNITSTICCLIPMVPGS